MGNCCSKEGFVRLDVLHAIVRHAVLEGDHPIYCMLSVDQSQQPDCSAFRAHLRAKSLTKMTDGMAGSRSPVYVSHAMRKVMRFV